MSHFSVTCITRTGDDDELTKLLAPYDENFEIEWVEDSEYDEGGYHHNPSAKWDWWEVGGRYRNRLLTLAGAKVNRSRVGDLAIDGMRSAAVEKARAAWASMEAVCGHLPEALLWQQIREQFGDDIDIARRVFHDQPRVEALKVLDSWDVNNMLVDYQSGWDRYVERQALTGPDFIGWAAVGAEGWIERGEMGWFGMANDTDDSTLIYGRHVNKLIDGLGSDIWLTIVDCHI